MNDRHYNGAPNPPIFLLEAGETDAVVRMDALDRGIVNILSEATGGIAVVLEHRYYGDSLPFDDFSTPNLRYLSYNQTLQDSISFIENFHNTSPYNDTRHSKWIAYGGSYAGARAAHLRTLFPEVVYGGIASSAVTHAEDDYWRYFDMIRLHQDSACVGAISDVIKLVDNILDIPLSFPKDALKTLFGLGGLSDVDFADLITYPLAFIQSLNWDDEVSSHKFQSFCHTLTEDSTQRRLLTHTLGSAPYSLLRYGQWIQKNVASKCPAGKTPVECFGLPPDISTEPSTMRAWGYQVCTQWGYFQGSPPASESDAYTHRLVSKRLSLDHTSSYCARDYNITERPRVDEINRLGDFDTRFSRLAFIDGSADPWREATPHSSRARPRKDTVSQPSVLIKGGTHHWDENGWRDYTTEPKLIRRVHDEAIAFVTSWLDEYFV